MNASCDGYVDCIKELINAGADVNAQNIQGSSPLMMVANNGLIASGAAISKQDRYGVTALMSASARGCLDCVKELLKAGSESNIIDLTDQKGNTALLYATRNGRKRMCEAAYDCRS